jgi:hypothetical protein
VKISPAQLRKIKIIFFLWQLELNFFSTSYFSVRAKTPLNARVYVVSNFQNNFWLKFFFIENHDFWSFLEKIVRSFFLPNSLIYRSHKSIGSFVDLQNPPFSGSPILIQLLLFTWKLDLSKTMRYSYRKCLNRLTLIDYIKGRRHHEPHLMLCLVFQVVTC